MGSCPRTWHERDASATVGWTHTLQDSSARRPGRPIPSTSMSLTQMMIAGRESLCENPELPAQPTSQLQKQAAARAPEASFAHNHARYENWSLDIAAVT